MVQKGRFVFTLMTIFLVLFSSVKFASGQTLPGGTLDPLTVPKYVSPLVIPPVMPNKGTSNHYEIAVRQFQQQILPPGFPATTVWSYGAAADPTPLIAPSPTSSFNYPAFTIETQSHTPVIVRWINDLKDTNGNFLPHLLPVDQTLHWANPPATGCRDGMNRTDCATNNPLPYTGPVPIVTHVHGAHVDSHSDGYPEAWWLPSANNIPSGYSMKGRFFDDSTGANPGHLGYADYFYRNDQPATTLWYHDHTLGMTRANVYAGPAGFWLIRGGIYDGAINSATGLPAVLPGPAPVAGEGVLDLNTPGNPVRHKIREIPIAIQDRSFNANGSLFYPASRAFFDGYLGPYTGSAPISTDIAPIWNPEAFFNTIVVNGRTWPVLEVAPALYRFRLLNGCNSRFLNLALFQVIKDPGNGQKQKNNAKLRAELPFYQIGAEQGFLPKVVMVQTGFATTLPGDGTIPPVLTPAQNLQQALLLGPAERADVIVDFRGLSNGTRIRMINTAPDAPFGGFPDVPSDPATTGQVMEFVVNHAMWNAPGSTDATATPPQNLVLNAEPPLGNATVTRNVSLNEEMSGQVCVKVTPSGRIKVVQVFSTPLPEADIITACAALKAVPMGPKAAKLGIVDLTNPAMPMGIPLMWEDMEGVTKTFSLPGGEVMVNVTENPSLGNTEEWDIYNFTVDAHPIHLHLVRFQVISRIPIPGVAPVPVPIGVLPWERGYKDTVIAYPGEITKVRALFDIPGLYVWHCHIVEHEDNEMMRPFVVSP